MIYFSNTFRNAFVKKFTVVFILLNLIFLPIKSNQPQAFAKPNQTEIKRQASLYFEANRGQFDKRVKFSARGAGYKLFLTSNEAVYVIPERQTKDAFQNQKSSRAVAVWMKLSGANKDANAEGVGELAGKHNYFKGGDQSKWRTNVPLYERARFENVYSGIDLEWRGNEAGSIEHDFIVSPFASARQIEWRIEGANSVKIDTDGSLVISTPFGELKQNAPFTYQKTGDLRNAVESRFEMRGENTVGFTVGEYDRSKPLTIDPASDLVYSTFLGGGTNEIGYAIAAGANDTVYITGETDSTAFPTTTGVYDETQNGDKDVFVTKLGAGGESLIYSTYIGGGAYDGGFAIAVDTQGNAYIAGGTIVSETPYPTTINAPFPNHGGDVDAFVTKLNASGSQFVYSTYLGGSGYDNALAIAVNSGRAYVTGVTVSSNYPTTPGAFDTTHNGGSDIFVTKIGAQGADLDYSTFIGGNENEVGRGIAVDGGGNAFICGRNNGGNYPTTTGAFDTTANSIYGDAIVTKLNAAGSMLGYSTYIGGDNGNDARAIAVDSSGSAYVTGDTNYFSVPFPTTAGAFDTMSGGDSDAFVTKFNPSGSALVYSTLIGGDGIDVGYGIAVNSTGNAFVTGRGGGLQTAFPTTAGAFDTTPNIGVDGSDEAFMTKLTASGASLIYSTIIGGNSFDRGYGIALNTAGEAYLTGLTLNGTVDFPVTDGAFQPQINGLTDAFVCKFAATPNVPIVRAPFDFDGDNKSDVSIFRPTVGEWWYLKSSNGGNYAAQFGASTDKLAPGDFTGDGRTDIAFFRHASGEWYVLRSEDSSYYSFPFGASGDVPVQSDFDGDGKTDAAVFRPSTATWYISKSSGGTTIQAFGQTNDTPVVGDYDGDGKSDLAIYRASLGQWWIQQSSLGAAAYTFGAPTDKPVQGDYTGDGKTDVAFWRPSSREWFILRSENLSYYGFVFGASGDISAPADYDGDGKFDPTLFRPSESNWYILKSTLGSAIVVPFGQNGDVPVAAK